MTTDLPMEDKRVPNRGGPPRFQPKGNQMAAYLRFYRLERAPFEGGKNGKDLVLGTHSLRAAYHEIKQGLDEGSPRICLTGSPGIGKTSLCRALPKLLEDQAQVVTILDPQCSWKQLRDTIAKRFGIDASGGISRRDLLGARTAEQRQLVIIVDQAEHLSHEALDHIDVLLQYRDPLGGQLLHCVLIANLESAATGVETPLLWWMDRYTTLQLRFDPIPARGIRHYVEKRLHRAGWSGESLFSDEALLAIHRNTGGLPRAINEICERALREAGVRGLASIGDAVIDEMCNEEVAQQSFSREGTSTASYDSWSSSGEPAALSAQELLDYKAGMKSTTTDEVEKNLFEKPLVPRATESQKSLANVAQEKQESTLELVDESVVSNRPSTDIRSGGPPPLTRPYSRTLRGHTDATSKAPYRGPSAFARITGIVVRLAALAFILLGMTIAFDLEGTLDFLELHSQHREDDPGSEIVHPKNLEEALR